MPQHMFRRSGHKDVIPHLEILWKNLSDKGLSLWA